MLFTKGQAIEFIEKVFGSGTATNQGQNISVVCPLCLEIKGKDYQKKKLAIRTDNFMVHCWVCGYKSRTIRALLKRFHGSALKEYVEVFDDSGNYLGADKTPDLATNNKLVLPKGFFPLFFQGQFHVIEKKKDSTEAGHKFEEAIHNASDYFFGRFSEEDLRVQRSKLLWYWKVGITKDDPAFKNRVIVPSFDANGDLNYYTARALNDKTFPRYLNPKVFREDVIFNEINIDWKEPLVITEGPFDMMKCGPNATCLLGSDLTTEYQLFLMLVKHKTPVILALDPDVKDKAIKIAELLFEYDVPVSILDIPSQYKDVGEMSQREFTSILYHVRPFTKDYSLREKIAGLLKNI